MKKINKNIFPSKKIMGRRQWGTETLLTLIPKKLSLKLLKIKKGKKGGFNTIEKKMNVDTF